MFAGRGRSISEAAKSSGADIRHLHHMVRKLCSVGLLEVVDVRRRPGRPIKLYRAVSDSFYIPLEVMPGAVSGGLNKEMAHCLAADSVNSVAGIVFTVDADGRPVGHWVDAYGEGPGPLDSWRILRLDPARFAELKAEILAVLDKFQAKPSKGGPVYLVHAAAARRIADTQSLDNSVSTLP